MILNTILLGVACVLLLVIFFKKTQNGLGSVERKVDELEKSLLRIENALREDFRINREENDKIARENRSELKLSLDQTSKYQTDKLESLINKIEEKNKDLRDVIEKSFKVFADNFDKNVKSFNDLQREKFAQLEEKQTKLVDITEKRLDQMRETVEEKLQKTLNDRLTQSFAMVGTQLESVQKGLGEMQNIASDVGGLKKVLSNVKLRGNVGEVQLAMLLEQILAPSQYDANVRTKAGSSDPVEFAIKLPGRSEDESSIVYLPIDAKFPKDIYEQLLSAYDTGSPEEIEASSKNLESTIKKMAKDIRDKYIDPPNTTDFAILFLPFESIYAEVIRRSALVDQLRDEFKITVAGPTTLVAILNSLQMGFRTLALQKRSSEVWKVLGSVKKEFETFGGLLEKAQKNIQAGLGQLDDIAGTRTRAIQRQLRDVESIPAVEAPKILTEIIADIKDEEI
jgi:DNA recombination protein RmuC